MNITRLVCEACGAAISSLAESAVVKCPYCGSTYLVESAAIAEEDGLARTIHRLLASAEGSKFGRLDRLSQDKVVADVLQQVSDRRYVQAIRIIRIYTGLDLREAKELTDQIPGWGKL